MSETYGDVQVQGSIEFAELKMGDFTIESQGTYCLCILP